MIGDNIETDITGPYELGWHTILVKTGVAKEDHHQASINCTDVWTGIQRYLKEGEEKQF